MTSNTKFKETTHFQINKPKRHNNKNCSSGTIEHTKYTQLTLISLMKLESQKEHMWFGQATLKTTYNPIKKSTKLETPCAKGKQK